MSKLKLYSILAIWYLSNTTSLAQYITGTVVEYKTGHPIENVTISLTEKPELNGKSNSMGEFSISNGTSNQTLKKRLHHIYISNRTLTINIESRQLADITMYNTKGAFIKKVSKLLRLCQLANSP